MTIDPQHIGLVAFSIAFMAGLLSFLSPCVLPLVPAYIGYLSGATFAGGQLAADRRRTTSHAIAFVLGFAMLFILIGAGFGLAAWLAQLLSGASAGGAGEAAASAAAVQAMDNLIEVLKHVLLRVGIVMLAVMAARIVDAPLGGHWRLQIGSLLLEWPERIGFLPQRYVRWALVGLATAVVYLWLVGSALAPHHYLDAIMLGILPLAGAGLTRAGAWALGVMAALLNTWSLRVGFLWSGSSIDLVTAAAEAVLIVLVVYFLSRTMLFYQEKRLDVSGRLRSRGYLTSAVTGAVFAAGWTPCVGPNLAVILVLAASAGSAGIGTALLIAYAAGLGVPFILAGYAFGAAAAGLKRLTPYMGLIKAVNMALLLLAAALLLSGRLSQLAQFSLPFGIDL